MFKTIYDITLKLGKETFDYPGDRHFRRTEEIIPNSGLTIVSSWLDMSAHAGTHIDTPAHFFRENYSLDSYELTDLIMPALVIDIEDAESIKSASLAGIEIEPGAALLFKTENSRSGRCSAGAFSESYVYMSQDAAAACVEMKAALAGIDYISMDRYSDETFPAHRALSGNNVIILEGLNLAEVPAGRYTLFCIPLRLSGAEASPVRAFLAC